MIGQRPAWESIHFQELVSHFELFSEDERARLARLYFASSQEPSALAMSVCVAPERMQELLHTHGLSAAARALLDSLVIEHGILVHVNGVGGNIHVLNELRDLGLLCWSDEEREPGEPLPVLFPGIFTLMVPREEAAARPSLFLLSAQLSDEDVEALAACHGLKSGSRIVMLIELAQRFASEHFMEGFLPQLGEPDQVGPAITALELGGMCYWQDVFGFDDSDMQVATAQGDAKVLPLVRDNILKNQQAMADVLREFGIIFKLTIPETEFPMLAVPEELWLNLWVLARDWVMSWLEHGYKSIQDTGSRLRDLDAHTKRYDATHFKRRLTWLCAALHHAPESERTPKLLAERLASSSALDRDACAHLIDFALSVDILAFKASSSQLELSSQAEATLNKSPTELAMAALSVWSVGQGPYHADRHLGKAAGVDDVWRKQARVALQSIMEEQGMAHAVPAWLDSEGVEHEMTGMGYLRDLDEVLDELLLAEFSMANSIVNYTRMLWLDVLSTLDEETWYRTETLAEILQFILAMALFHHLAHLFEHPELSQYIPVQRPDYLTLPVHMDALLEWSNVLISELLAPLGLACVVDDRVRLKTKALRLEGPAEMTHEFRERFMNMLLGLESFPIGDEALASKPFSLRILSGVKQAPEEVDVPGELSLDEALDVILEQLGDATRLDYDEPRGVLVFS